MKYLDTDVETVTLNFYDDETDELFSSIEITRNEYELLCKKYVMITNCEISFEEFIQNVLKEIVDGIQE